MVLLFSSCPASIVSPIPFANDVNPLGIAVADVWNYNAITVEDFDCDCRPDIAMSRFKIDV